MAGTTAYRPRRSVLYMPELERAGPGEGQDAPGRRPDPRPRGRGRARRQGDRADERLRGSAHRVTTGGARSTIRINGIGTAVARRRPPGGGAAGPDGIVVPKVGSAARGAQLVAAMEAAGAPERTTLWAMVETPHAMLHCEEIAAALGPADRPRHGHERPGQGAARRARARAGAAATGLSLCLLAARATGTVILDGVFNDVSDLDGFEAECVQGRQLGFDGKTLIHPGQVDVCNEAFAPSAAAVEDAQGVLAAWEAGGVPAWSPTAAGWSRTCTSRPPNASWRSTRRSPAPPVDRDQALRNLPAGNLFRARTSR